MSKIRDGLRYQDAAFIKGQDCIARRESHRLMLQKILRGASL
jgi:hypothetical protein